MPTNVINRAIPTRTVPVVMTTAQWATNVALGAGAFVPEQGEEVDEWTGSAIKVKKGDGVNNFAGLPYLTSGISTPQTLQDTLNLGNSATDGGGNTGQIQLLQYGDASELDLLSSLIQIADASGNFRTFLSSLPIIELTHLQGNLIITDGVYGVCIDKKNINIIRASDGFLAASLNVGSTNGALVLSDVVNNFKTLILPSALTADRFFFLPNDSTGVQADDTLLTHKSKSGLNVYTVATFNTQYDPNGVSIQDGSNINAASLVYAAGNATLNLRSGALTGKYATFKAGVLTATRTFTTPDHSGEIATNSGGANSQTFSSGTFLTIPHGLSFTPTRIFVAPNDATTSNNLISGYYVDNITGANFRLNMNATPTGQTININFQCF